MLTVHSTPDVTDPTGVLKNWQEVLNIYAKRLAMWQDCGMSQDLKPEDIFRINVKSQREALGWNQATLLSKLHELGYDSFHQTTLSRIEKGVQPPKLGEAIAIAKALNTKVSALLVPQDTFSTIQNFAEDVAHLRRGWLELRMAIDKIESFREITPHSLASAREELERIKTLEGIDELDVERMVMDEISDAERMLSRSYSEYISSYLEYFHGNGGDPDYAS